MVKICFINGFFHVLLTIYRLTGICRRSGTDWCCTNRNVSGKVPFCGVTEQIQRDIGRPPSAAASHAQVFFRVSYFKSSEYSLLSCHWQIHLKNKIIKIYNCLYSLFLFIYFIIIHVLNTIYYNKPWHTSLFSYTLINIIKLCGMFRIKLICNAC